MAVLNLGSLNIDKTYLVEHIVRPKETIVVHKSYSGSGGKGLNQSVALARAGADVSHAGLIGIDGRMLVRTMNEAGVKTNLIRTVTGSSGHAIIQLNESGENSIIVDKGVNDDVDKDFIDEVLAGFGAGDILLLQNEISNVSYAIEAAARKKMTIAFNMSPVNEACFHYPLEMVDYFLVNEIEASAMVDQEEQVLKNPDTLIAAVRKRYPKGRFVITLGEQGAYYADREQSCYQSSYQVIPVDTTGAGDTFCGYFLAQIAVGRCVKDALRYASAASAIAVGRKGASPSIPDMKEVGAFLDMRR